MAENAAPSATAAATSIGASGETLNSCVPSVGASARAEARELAAAIDEVVNGATATYAF